MPIRHLYALSDSINMSNCATGRAGEKARYFYVDALSAGINIYNISLAFQKRIAFKNFPHLPPLHFQRRVLSVRRHRYVFDRRRRLRRPRHQQRGPPVRRRPHPPRGRGGEDGSSAGPVGEVRLQQVEAEDVAAAGLVLGELVAPQQELRSRANLAPERQRR